MSRIEDILKERILVLDGAMGTAIQQYGLTEEDFRGSLFASSSFALKGNNDILNLTQPHIIQAIHQAYIEAGADIIETNTFNSNCISQQEYGCQEQIYELNYQGAKLAREIADRSERKVWVAGSIGPTSKTLSLASDITKPAERSVDFDTLTAAYSSQLEALIDGGIDLILIETVFDALNTKAALLALSTIEKQRNINLNVMISATVNDKSGRTLTGQQIEALYHSLSHRALLSFGLNCSFGASDLRPFIEQLAQTINCHVSIYPNAGLPNEMGQYDEAPEYTASCLLDMAQDGLLNIIGGCCGTTPDHIRAIAQTLAHCTPHQLPTNKHILHVSGLESVVIDKETSNFINVGERTNVAGSRKFARLIAEKNYDEAIEIARKQIEDGASIIDINMDDAMLNATEEMQTFIRILNNEPDVAKAALMIDSSNWETLIVGLKNAQGKSIVNSISLKEGEALFIEKAEQIKALGAAVVVMAFDEEGQAVTFEHKIAICERAYRILTEKVAFAPEDIIFDVNVLTIGTGVAEHARYGIDFISAVEWIKTNLPYAKCSGGISNLSFAFRGNNIVREAMHSVFLYHAIKVGLDMAIVNPSMLQVYDEIDPQLLKAVEDVLFNTDEMATDRLIDLANQLKGDKESLQQKRTSEWRESPLEERLQYALIKGITTYLTEDLEEALATYSSPVSIIEQPLMKGMDKIGDLFGSGKMFLPQVVKSARVMKQAVDVLQPAIIKFNEEQGETLVRKKVVLATAKGDVHDIGKNIVKIVLTCNNIEVIDLGVMVDSQTIVEAAIKEQVDAIGVSGLITPSLKEMEILCELLERKGVRIPLFVGGATTSKLHTAVKLAPLYDYCVVQGGDASQTVSLLKRLFAEPEYTIAQIKASQEALRQHYRQREQKLLTIEEAHKRAPKLTMTSQNMICESINETDYELSQLIPYIDWTPLLHFWGFKGLEKEILIQHEEARKLLIQAKTLVEQVIKDKSMRGVVALEFSKAKGTPQAIELADTTLLPMLRQQTDLEVCYSLADFVGKEGDRQIGLFTLAVLDIQEHINDDFERLLRQSVAQRLTEALAEHVHQKVANGTQLIRPAFGYSSCPDHSIKQLVFDYLALTPAHGLTLTESFSISPSTAICGLLIEHPEARYFSVNRIGSDQYEMYNSLRGLTSEQAEKQLGNLL